MVRAMNQCRPCTGQEKVGKKQPISPQQMGSCSPGKGMICEQGTATCQLDLRHGRHRASFTYDRLRMRMPLTILERVRQMDPETRCLGTGGCSSRFGVDDPGGLWFR